MKSFTLEQFAVQHGITQREAASVLQILRKSGVLRLVRRGNGLGYLRSAEFDAEHENAWTLEQLSAIRQARMGASA